MAESCGQLTLKDKKKYSSVGLFCPGVQLEMLQEVSEERKLSKPITSTFRVRLLTSTLEHLNVTIKLYNSFLYVRIESDAQS